MKGRICLALVCLLAISSCVQYTSDGDLRDVPVTNNPQVLPDSARTAYVPGFGM